MCFLFSLKDLLSNEHTFQKTVWLYFCSWPLFLSSADVNVYQPGLSCTCPLNSQEVMNLIKILPTRQVRPLGGISEGEINGQWKVSASHFSHIFNRVKLPGLIWVNHSGSRFVHLSQSAIDSVMPPTTTRKLWSFLFFSLMIYSCFIFGVT